MRWEALHRMIFRDSQVSPQDVSWDDALDFWQKEVHYYESRAGEQGASANRMVTLAAGAAAIVPLIANTMSNAATIHGVDSRLFLYVVPAVILLLWAISIRLLHEMYLLREYRYHAELQVVRLGAKDSRLAAYRPWETLGGRYDMSQPITLTWIGLTALISLAGVVGVIWGLWPFLQTQAGPWWAWLPTVIAIAIVAILCLSLVKNGRDSDRLAADLGNPPRKTRIASSGGHQP